MLNEERYALILGALKDKGAVTVTGIAEQCAVSCETVRRDLIYLEGQGVLRRVFGGAVTNPVHGTFPDLMSRRGSRKIQKEAVARKLSELIREGDVLSLDAGTTALEIAMMLRTNFRNLTVLTYSLEVFRMLQEHFTVLLTGGEYYAREGIFHGEIACKAASELHTGMCILCPSAIDPESGIEDYLPCAAPVQRALMLHSDRVIVAADSAKYGSRALIRLCDVSPAHLYLTDGELDRETAEAFQRKGLTLLQGGCDADGKV